MTFNKTNPPDESIDFQPNQKHFVYILKCADGSFCVGSAIDLEDRLRRHNSGKGAVFTASRRPVKLVYKEPKYKPWELITYLEFKDRSRALSFEKYLKSHSGKAFANKRLW